MKDTALASIHEAQSSDGGFPFMAASGQPSDPNSTAVVIQGLIAYGSSPTTHAEWNQAGGTPFTALASYQLQCAPNANDNGSFTFPGVPGPNVFATVQSVPAAAAKKLPVARSVRIGKLAAPCATSTGACAGITGVTVLVDLERVPPGREDRLHDERAERVSKRCN